MCTDEHLSQLNEVTVFFVIHLNNAPWVTSTTDFASISSCNLSIGTNNCKGNLGHDFMVFGNGLFIIQLISGAFKD
jgi:hypothetical protein